MKRISHHIDIATFAKKIGNLKRVKRAGWVRIGVKNPESVADHIFRLSIISLVIAEELGVDRSKLVELALVHDLAESLVGDIVAERGKKDQKAKVDKSYKEEEAMKILFNNAMISKRYLDLWWEYETQNSPEAKILKQLDKFEMVMQALEYEQEKAAKPSDFDEFWENAKLHIKESKLVKILGDLEKKRKND